MAKNLLIVESPAKAKTIEKYLGEDFTVKASYGHVRDLPKDDKAIDIENGFTPKYEIIPDKKSVIKELKSLIKKHDTVWLATDEDREGEAISWHLAQALGLDLNTTRRIVFNEITRSAITSAIENPRSINQDLVNAQQARRILDRLVGFRLSPILWKKVRAGLSAGRVQSVAVRLIVEREREIMAFQPDSAFRVEAAFWPENSNSTLKAEIPSRQKDRQSARAFIDSCVGADYTITKMETKPSKKRPAPPFTTSTLQQEASRKLSFSVGQTMRVAQSLYEAGKITYMRTDGVNLAEQARGQAQQVITELYGETYGQERTYKNKNSNAQEAHEAIRPTDLSLTEFTELGRNEQRLYDLIWKRTLASQMSDAQLEKTTVDIKVSSNEAIFKARGEVLKFDGFLKLYLESTDDENEDEEAKGVLPPLSVGQMLKLDQMTATQRFTRPPARYTEASLVKKLEELGIGRPSTYAPTISTIQRREYAIKESRDGHRRDYEVITLKDDHVAESIKQETTGAEKSKLFPSDLGMVVNDFLVKFFPEILDYKFTAKVEEQFDEIAEGEKVWQDMLAGFYKDFDPLVTLTQETAERESGERELGVHPKSGRRMIVRLGRYGPMVQIGTNEDEEKPIFKKLRSNQRLETITMEEALELFRLPRVLGEYEEQPVKTNIGRFGPYVQLGKLFASLEDGDDPYEIELPRAIELIQKKRETEAKKLIHRFNDDVAILNGRWGPYIKYGKANVKIPKDVEDPKTLTLEDCTRLFEEAKNNPKKGRGKAKAKAKKTTAKKTSKKK